MPRKTPRKDDRFSYLVSPLGQDAKQDPAYSPSKTVYGSFQPKEGKASQRESARDQRRGG